MNNIDFMSVPMKKTGIGGNSGKLNIYTFDSFMEGDVLSASDTGTNYIADDLIPRHIRENIVKALKISCKSANLDPADWPLFCFYEEEQPVRIIWPFELGWPDNIRPSFVIPVNLRKLAEKPDVATLEAEQRISFLGFGLGGMAQIGNLGHLEDATKPDKTIRKSNRPFGAHFQLFQ